MTFYDKSPCLFSKTSTVDGHCGPQRIKNTSGHWLHLSNCLHLKRLSHWSCKFDFSPLCGLNVSSSRLYKRKQSRTGCICMTCMGWDKLSVIGVSTDLKIVQRSSSPTAKKNTSGHCSHLFVFLHCTCSCVSSNCLPQKIQSCFGHTSLTFLHCAF